MYQHIFISDKIIESSFVSNKTSEITSCFPLYLYPDEDTLMSDGQRTANLDMDILGPVLEKLGAEWVEDGSGKDPQTPSEGATRMDAIRSNVSIYADTARSPLGGEMPKAEGSVSSEASGKDLQTPSEGATRMETEGSLRNPTTRKRNIELTKKSVSQRGLVWDGKSFPYNPNNVERAKKMRKDMTKGEQRMWFEILKNHEYKFYKQRPIDHFIADFYCSKLDLVIEIDGDSHHAEGAAEYDKMRTDMLELYGLHVLRFTNEEVRENIEGVSQSIQMYIDEKIKDPQTPSKGATRIDASTYATSSPLGGEMPKAEGSRIGPEDIFDYIYAVLHSPSYRETYQEFLKIDFPRIPFTDKLDVFWQLVAYGRELRGYHLMETIEMGDISELGLGYIGDGDNTVTRVGNKSRVLDEGGETGRVYIQDEQYFDHIPLVAWEFYIGGYQPAQKRLKDRKGKTLSYDDIIHYQKIIVALTHTARVMREIDKVKFL